MVVRLHAFAILDRHDIDVTCNSTIFRTCGRCSCRRAVLAARHFGHLQPLRYSAEEPRPPYRRLHTRPILTSKCSLIIVWRKQFKRVDSQCRLIYQALPVSVQIFSLALARRNAPRWAGGRGGGSGGSATRGCSVPRLHRPRWGEMAALRVCDVDVRLRCATSPRERVTAGHRERRSVPK